MMVAVLSEGSACAVRRIELEGGTLGASCCDDDVGAFE